MKHETKHRKTDGLTAVSVMDRMSWNRSEGSEAHTAAVVGHEEDASRHPRSASHRSPCTVRCCTLLDFCSLRRILFQLLIILQHFSNHAINALLVHALWHCCCSDTPLELHRPGVSTKRVLPQHSAQRSVWKPGIYTAGLVAIDRYAYRQSRPGK